MESSAETTRENQVRQEQTNTGPTGSKIHTRQAGYISRIVPIPSSSSTYQTRSKSKSTSDCQKSISSKSESASEESFLDESVSSEVFESSVENESSEVFESNEQTENQHELEEINKIVMFLMANWKTIPYEHRKENAYYTYFM